MTNAQETAGRLDREGGASRSTTDAGGQEQSVLPSFPSFPAFPAFAWRVIALHTMTYMIVGLAAFFLADYGQLFENTELRHLMRPTTSPWVAIGPALQVVRGMLFALVLYPFASELIRRKNGAWLLWSLFFGLAILGTAGPSPGSLEGIIYTKVELIHHLRGLPEVLLQTALFSFGLTAWCRKPARWKNVLSIVAVALVLLMSVLGAFAAMGMLPAA